MNIVVILPSIKAGNDYLFIITYKFIKRNLLIPSKKNINYYIINRDNISRIAII